MHILSGTYPSTCLAWETLPVAMLSLTALQVIGVHKRHHHNKVETPGGDISLRMMKANLCLLIKTFVK
jgi:hypothetical protein